MNTSDTDTETPRPSRVYAHNRRWDPMPRMLPNTHTSKTYYAKRDMVISIIILIGGIIMCVAGIINFTHAEHERLHGWQRTLCTLRSNRSLNNTACIYLTAYHNERALCAVPAVIAIEARFHDPPACHANTSRTDQTSLGYWRAISNAQVECLVPLGTNAVSAEHCVEMATSHSLGATAWRLWSERFVYLMQEPREGSDAVTNVTSPQRGVGIALLIAAIITLLIGCCAFLIAQLAMSELDVRFPTPHIGHVMRRRRARAQHLD